MKWAGVEIFTYERLNKIIKIKDYSSMKELSSYNQFKREVEEQAYL